MKITHVEAYLVEEEVPHPFVWRNGLPGSGNTTMAGWLRICVDEGIDGWSRVVRGAGLLEVVRWRLQDLLIGRDPLDKERLWHEMWELDRMEELPIYVLGAVDVALWDITGKIAGLPLYQLLGGFRPAIPAYASTVTFDSVSEYLEVADQCIAHGFTAIKLHAWGDVRRDAELSQRLRSHVGPEIRLMYDGSAGFDFVDALFVGRALEEADYFWYEEPMREFSVAAYSRLCAELDIPVLAAETSDGCHFNVADFIVFRAADLVRTSTHFKGGFTGGLRIAHLADSFHLRAEVHAGGPANLQLALAIPNTTYYESLITSNPIDVEPAVNHEGLVHAPPGPGIGYELDPQELSEQALSVVT